VEDVAATWFVGLDDLAAVELAADLAQGLEQASGIPSDAAGVLPSATVERDSQPRVP
jgi:hypothetical protein